MALSLGFRHYASLQTQPLHRFLWSGIGAVALAFSFFLSILFLLKTTEHYSRATFFFQLLTVTVAVLGIRVVSHGRIRAAIAVNRIEARRAILVGDGARHARIVARLRHAGVSVVRSVPFPEGIGESAGGSPEGAGRGATRRLIEICRVSRIDDVVILASSAESAGLGQARRHPLGAARLAASDPGRRRGAPGPGACSESSARWSRSSFCTRP